MPRHFTLILSALTVAACHSAPPRGPQRLALLPAASGAPPPMVAIQVGESTRQGLVERTVSQVFLPRRGLLSFGLSAGRGKGSTLLDVTFRSEGRVLGRRTLDSRTLAFDQTSVAFEGPGRTSTLEVDLRLTDLSGRAVPQSSAGPAAITDPTLFDRDAVRGVVLVSIDTLRRDHVSLYGYSRPTTPRLDALARQGVAFHDAVSVSSWTLPAHLSMLTSAVPARHGGIDGHHGFNGSVPPLAETLRRSGFLTHAITSHLYVSPTYGVNAGFDVFDYEADRNATEVANRAKAALDGFGERPFLLFLHFYDPHWPYDAPSASRRRFGALPQASLGSRPPAEAAPPHPARLIDAYDAEIHHVDEQLGRVLDHLDQTGQSRHTLVVVTSDHGEEFAEHGGYEHLRTLYDEVLRIPLVVRGPRVEARAAAAQVSLLDIAPTVLAAVGLPKEPSHEGQNLLGAIEPREAYGETEFGSPPGAPRARKLFLRQGQSGPKLVLTLDRRTDTLLLEEWFDLHHDPRELASAPPGEPSAATWRHRLLERWRAARATDAQRATVTLGAEDEARLRALGYLGR